jgi:glycosidase
MGEIVHGDYRHWANPQTLDAVTNYECYKGLYSSLNDRNYFEIAYALERQFGPNGLYRGLPLYNFGDNHDVNRVASSLRQAKHLYPLYALLLTMPGVPSIYYGSEWGVTGRRERNSDRALRPCLELSQAGPQRDLALAIARLAEVRRRLPALRHGDYRPLSVSAQQLTFVREAEGQCVIVALNAADQAQPLKLPVPCSVARALVDVLNGDERFEVREGCAQGVVLPPCWARILLVQS